MDQKEVEYINPSMLIPYARNSRTHSQSQISKLRSSLREFGFVNPVLIDSGKNIIAGHGRVEAAIAENMHSVPCVVVNNLTDAQKRAYIIADNRLALDAGWDAEMLKVELEELNLNDFDLSLTGFDELEIEQIIDAEVDKKDDGFDVEKELEQIVTPNTKPGDIYLLGNHRLMCGDSTDKKKC